VMRIATVSRVLMGALRGRKRVGPAASPRLEVGRRL
jgi:hypothetical protein